MPARDSVSPEVHEHLVHEISFFRLLKKTRIGRLDEQVDGVGHVSPADDGGV